jgi:phosphoribosylformylglycinamidine synthase
MHKTADSRKPRVAVVVFPGTNSEAETVDACRDAGMDARLFWWSEDPEALRGFDGYVLAGGFAHEDRVRAGAIAAKSPIVSVIKEEAEKGKLVLGLCNGAQVLAEAGILGKVALAHNLPARHFQGLMVDVVVDREPQRCAFTDGLAPGTTMTMALAHGEGRFTGEPAVLEDLEEHARIVLRYAGAAPNGSADRAAGVCNERGNVLALMPHPERAAWAFNVAYDRTALRGQDPNLPAPAHAIFARMAAALRASQRSGEKHGSNR